MSLPLPSWKDRLSLSVDGKLIPMRDATFTYRAPKERLHTVQKPNAGFHHMPHEFSVSFNTYVISDIGSFLMDMVEADLETVELVLSKSEGPNFSFDSLVYSPGTISSVTISGVEARSVPMMSVECEFLDCHWNQSVTS